MLGTIINCAAVILGSIIGLLFRKKITDRYTQVIDRAIGLCVLVYGISCAIKTEYFLVMVICVMLGYVLGELIGIEHWIERAGDKLKAAVSKGGSSSRFTEGFMTSSILFCTGAMTVLGCINAGVSHDYDVLFSKSVMDFTFSIVLCASMGIGVLFSSVYMLVFQGGLTLLAIWLGSGLSSAVVGEMTAVGGVLLVALGLNCIEISDRRIPVGNLMPAIFLPIAFVPLYDLVVRHLGGVL